MRPYEQAFEAARDRPAFSTGTEGETWVANWCERCVHDLGEGCPLVLVSLMQRTPMEWLDGPRDEQGRYSMADQYHCVEYRDRDDPGPGYEPPSDPPLPGQETLFDAAPHTRMYADTVIRPASVGGAR